MEFFIQQLVNAISLGGIYALLALGLAVVFSIVGLINFAHGELMTVAGYGLFFAIGVSLGLPLAIVIAILAAVAMALLIERVAFRPMRRADVTGLLLTSFAVSVILRVLFQNGISARGMPVPMPSALAGSIDLGFAHIGVIPLLSIVATAVSLTALLLFLKHTVVGTAMRAAAQDFAVVRLMGIPANRVVAVAFAVSGVLAGVAAFLWVAQRGSVDPLMGFVPVLKAFVAAIIGGLGGLAGAVVGGFVLGALEVICQAFLPASILPYRDAFVLSIVILILVLRPEGLIPAQTGKRS